MLANNFDGLWALPLAAQRRLAVPGCPCTQSGLEQVSGHMSGINWLLSHFWVQGISIVVVCPLPGSYKYSRGLRLALKPCMYFLVPPDVQITPSLL